MKSTAQANYEKRMEARANRHGHPITVLINRDTNRPTNQQFNSVPNKMDKVGKMFGQII